MIVNNWLYGLISWKAAVHRDMLPRHGELYIQGAVSSEGVMYHFSGPNTGSNPGGRRILKKNLQFKYTQRSVCQLVLKVWRKKWLFHLFASPKTKKKKKNLTEKNDVKSRKYDAHDKDFCDFFLRRWRQNVRQYLKRNC